MTVDRLEVVVFGGGFAPFAPGEMHDAEERACEIDAVGIVRERLCDGSIGRSWRVEVERHRLNDRRVRVAYEAAA